jgi:hypothetical protein
MPVVVDGHRIITGSSWSNRRTTVNREFFTLRRQNRQFVVSSTRYGRGRSFADEAAFSDFFRSTFGGWRAEIEAADAQERARAVRAARQEELDRQHEEAAQLNDFLDRVVASGVVSLEEAIHFTTGFAREVAEVARQAGYDDGRNDGYDAGHNAGYESASEDHYCEHDDYDY